LPQGIDRAGEISNLIGQPLGIGLLGCQQTLHGLQLVLNDLQLVDRFLLGRFQTLGFFDELFGGLRGAGL